MNYLEFKSLIKQWKQLPTVLSDVSSDEEKAIYKKINRIPQDRFQKYFTRWVQEEGRERINPPPLKESA